MRCDSAIDELDALSRAPNWDDPRPLYQQLQQARDQGTALQIDGRSFGQRIVEGAIVGLIVAVVLGAMK